MDRAPAEPVRNVEQALDDAMPGWRDQRMIKASLKSIQAAYRRAAVAYAGHPDNTLLPQARAMAAVRNIVPEVLNQRALAVHHALAFALAHTPGPHAMAADDVDD